MKDQSDWISLMNDNAFISLADVKKWLNIGTAWQMRRLVEYQSFPMPAYGTSQTARMSRGCRWRVGDIREWLKTGKCVNGCAEMSERLTTRIASAVRRRLNGNRIAKIYRDLDSKGLKLGDRP